MRFEKRVFAALVLSIGVLAEACSPSVPSSGPSPAPVSPVPQTSPTPTSTASPADIEATLNRVTQYDRQLKQLGADSPSPDDLVNTLQEVLTLADYVTTYYPQMTAQQRSQALGGLTDILGDEMSVVNTHARVFPATATAFAVAHPTATTGPGTPTPAAPPPQATLAPATQGPTATVGAGTPTPNPIARQVAADLEAIRGQTVAMVAGQPTDQDIVGILRRLQADLGQLRQPSSGMSDADVVSVLKDMDRAIAYLVPVVQNHAGGESNSVATSTPIPTATPPATPGPAPAGTPTPGS